MADDVRRLSDELARDPVSLAFVPLAEALRRQGQVDHALKIALRGLERHPHLADAHDLLARIHADRGDTERAFDEWDMVRRLAPGHAGAAKGMGFVRYSQGAFAEAERYLAEAAAGAPDDSSIAAALTMVRAAARDAARAHATGVVAAETRSSPPAPAPASAAGDPRALFAALLPDADQTALLLDRDGLVLGGTYRTSGGDDIAQEVGAELSGVSVEAARAARHLGIGAWRSIVFEADAAIVSMAPSADDGLVVLATGPRTPLGLARRILDRCTAYARTWLGGVS